MGVGGRSRFAVCQIVAGMQLITRAYPVAVSLNARPSSGPARRGSTASCTPTASGTGMRAARIYAYAWLIAGIGPAYDGKWWDSTTWRESQIVLKSGVGYW